VPVKDRAALRKLILQLMEPDSISWGVSLSPKPNKLLNKLVPRLSADLLVEKQDSSGLQDLQEPAERFGKIFGVHKHSEAKDEVRAFRSQTQGVQASVNEQSAWDCLGGTCQCL